MNTDTEQDEQELTPEQKAERKRVRALERDKINRRKRINGATAAGRDAKAWRAYALEKKGAACPPDVKHKIEAGCFALWRALELRAEIMTDAKQRGTPINKRHRRLPAINAEYDKAFEQWQRINAELELGKGTDLARRLSIGGAK